MTEMSEQETAANEAEDLRSRLACIAEATYWDRPYDVRMEAIRGMCDLTQNGFTPIPAPVPGGVAARKQEAGE